MWLRNRYYALGERDGASAGRQRLGEDSGRADGQLITMARNERSAEEDHGTRPFRKVSLHIKMDLLFTLTVLILMLTHTSYSTESTPTGKHANETMAAKLLNRILNKSDSRIRPNIYGAPVEIFCEFYVASFGSINAVDMDFVIDVFFRQQWTDERLAFRDEEDIPFMPDSPLVVSAKSLDKLWLPDLFFPNEKSANFHDVTVINKVAMIYPNGTIRYSARMTIKLACPMVLTHFPMDYQNCFIKISSYSYTKQEVMLGWRDASPVEMNDEELSLPQFELLGISTATCSQHYKTGDFDCLIVLFHLKRQFGYYLLQAYIPSILIVILSWLSFWIHKEAVPARITLGVTTVLTMATQLSSSRGTSMTVSYAKAIDVWYAFCMIIVFSALVEYAIVNSLTRKELKAKQRKVEESPSSGAMGNTEDVEMQIADGAASHRDRRPLLVRLRSNVRQLLNMKEDSLSSHKIDRVSRFLFPATFAMFNVLYWIIYTQPVVFSDH